MSCPLEFTLNGRPVRVEGVSPNTTLLEFLRGSGLTGSKEGCAEGDCGACSVAIVERDADGKPVFQISKLSDGEYPFYWSGTTHLDGPPGRTGGAAVYVCFGRAPGGMQFPPGVGEFRLLDVHGAGAHRSDPKAGHPAAFPHGRGPQGDVIRIYNFVCCVRDCVK